ncbi:MAG: hypothetical protein DI537_42550 [Stutzerimonas stutzeri]|nr:MAG: hypothetical protein DI537_42550 [Stutzerimonas stutzeri]
MSAEWDAALSAYRAARADEIAHDERSGIATACRMVRAGMVGVQEAFSMISHTDADESERLCEIRGKAEDCMMGVPSPHAMAFALKYLIAHGDGRETDHWDDMLETEAKRFVGSHLL